MSPTSTELRSRARSSARFRRTLAGLITALVILCAVFFTLGFMQGPKLSSAQVDTKAVVEQPGQQLRLFANQHIAQVAADQVVITPPVAHHVTTHANTIAVQFDSRLNYHTHYTVQVRGATSIYQAQPSTLSYSFTTASPDIYYLHRQTGLDQIIRTSINGTARTVVYSAASIQEFAAASNVLAVVILSSDKTSSLDLVGLTDGIVEHVPLPEAGVIEKLSASASGTVLGFTFTSAGDSITPNYSATLMAVDLERKHTPQPVLGLTGKQIHVIDWRFMPAGSQLAALTLDRTLLVIDPMVANSASPHGQFNSLGSISLDGTSITLTDPLGPASLSLTDSSKTRLQPSPVTSLDGRAYMGDSIELTAASRVQVMVVSLPGDRLYANLVALDDGSTSRILYRTPNDAGSIEGFVVSPNGQYVAVEVVPNISAGTTDGYFYDAKDITTETDIIDIATGETVRSVDGFGIQW